MSVPEYIATMNNALNAKLAGLKGLSEQNPNMAFLYAEAEKAAKSFSSSMTSDMNNHGHLAAASYNDLISLVSINIMTDRIMDESSQGRFDYYNKLKSLNPDQFQAEVSRVTNFTRHTRDLYGLITNGTNADSVGWATQVLNDTKRFSDSYRNRYSYEHIFQFNHNYFKQAFAQLAPTINANNTQFINQLPQFAKVANGSARAYNELYQMNNYFDSSMHINEQAIKSASRIIAYQQIEEVLKAEAKDRSYAFTNKFAKFKPEEYEAFVDMLATGIDASGVISNSFRGSDPFKNEQNFLNVLANPQKISQDLLKHRYFRQTFLSVMDPEVPKTKAKDFKEMSTKLKTDAIVNIANKRSEEYSQTMLDQGGYNLGKQTFDYTKDDMLKFGTLLNQRYLSGDTNIFKDMDNPENIMGKELKELHEGLQATTTAFIQFGNTRNLAGGKLNTSHQEDIASLNQAEQQLNKMVKNCEKILVTNMGDDPEFQTLYANIIDASAHVQSIKNGSLETPDPEAKYEKGKLIHRINAPNPDASTLGKKHYGNNPVPENVKVNWNPSKDPIFAHDPCPDDIAQGSIGDCYFVSSLMAVASKNPNKIREMMHYNEKDNTVTVKLYSMQNEPVYVTVENSIPTLDTTENGKVVSSVPLTNQGARWVALIEKAYAASGIHLDEDYHRRSGSKVVTDTYMNAVENGTYKPSMKDISGGWGFRAMKTILGPDIADMDKEVNEILNPNFIPVPKNPGPIFPKQYSNEDLAFYNRLQADYNNGHPLTCSINSIKNTIDDKDMTNGILGLPSGHEYAIVGFSQDGNTRYVHVKNPHAGGYRGYDQNGNPMHVNDQDGLGISKLELKDFTNCFNTVGSVNYHEGPARKNEEETFEQNRILYEDTIRSIDSLIQDESVGTKRNPATKEYHDFRCASKDLIAAFRGEAHDMNKLNRAYNRYFTAANKYAQVHEGSKIKKDSDAQKFLAANMIQKVQQQFYANQALPVGSVKPCEYDDIKADVMKISETDSLAKKTAVKIIGDKERAQMLESQKRRDKLLGKITDFENGFSKYISKASKKNDYNKMIESISQCLYIEEVKQGAANMSESVLKNKLDLKTIKSNVEDTKYYVSEVLKDVPEETIKQKLFDLKDPQQILSNFKQLREVHREKGTQLRDKGDFEVTNDSAQMNV